MAPHLSEAQIVQAQSLRQNGDSYRQIASFLKITYCQAYHACRRKGTVSRSRSGRPPKLAKDEVQRLLTYLTTEPTAQEYSWKEIYAFVKTQWQWNVCEMTVRRVLHEAGYRPRN